MGSVLSQKAGARLAIHDSRSFPVVDENGVDLQPGTSNSVAIRTVAIVQRCVVVLVCLFTNTYTCVSNREK